MLSVFGCSSIESSKISWLDCNSVSFFYLRKQTVFSAFSYCSIWFLLFTCTSKITKSQTNRWRFNVILELNDLKYFLSNNQQFHSRNKPGKTVLTEGIEETRKNNPNRINANKNMYQIFIIKLPHSLSLNWAYRKTTITMQNCEVKERKKWRKRKTKFNGRKTTTKQQRRRRKKATEKEMCGEQLQCYLACGSWFFFCLLFGCGIIFFCANERSLWTRNGLLYS